VQALPRERMEASRLCHRTCSFNGRLYDEQRGDRDCSKTIPATVVKDVPFKRIGGAWRLMESVAGSTITLQSAYSTSNTTSTFVLWFADCRLGRKANHTERRDAMLARSRKVEVIAGNTDADFVT
jgi:hypothetical protein